MLDGLKRLQGKGFMGLCLWWCVVQHGGWLGWIWFRTRLGYRMEGHTFGFGRLLVTRETIIRPSMARCIFSAGFLIYHLLLCFSLRFPAIEGQDLVSGELFEQWSRPLSRSVSPGFTPRCS